MDPLALTARQVEQGQLAWGDGWSALGKGAAAGRGRAAPSLLPLEPRLWGPAPTYPVIHILLSGGSQTHGPPLPGPVGGVQGEGMLGLIEHRDQGCHLVEEYVQVLRTEGNSGAVTGDGQTAWVTPRPQSWSSGPWPAGFGGGV